MPRGVYKRGVSTAQEYITNHTFIDKNGCWVWSGSMHQNGYGTVDAHRWGYWSAHRLSYAAFNGELIKGMEIDHLCRNRACANPDHLEQVTKSENCFRGFSPQAINARKTHCAKGHEFTPENTYARSSGGRQCRACQLEAVARYAKRKKQK